MGSVGAQSGRRIYFVAGLPRSGSTLLCNLLMQNPRFYASATSGLCEVLRGLRDGWVNVPAMRAMPEEECRRVLLDTLRSVLWAYYEHVEQPVVFDNQTWNRRYRGFMDKIKTGSVFDVAEVMRDLYRLQVEKSLSFGEKKMLETARNLVVKEIAVARSRSEESTQAEIEQIFEKN